MNARNKFLILLGVILIAATVYYLLSTPRSSDLVLIGTVDSNQVIVSPQIQGRISKLLVDEGTQVKQGDLIAVLDPSELEAEARAAAAMIDSLRSQVSASQATSQATHGSTSSNVVNAQARLQSARAQLLQAEATLQRTESDSRRMIELAKQGVASDQDRVQAESNLKAQQATVQSLKDQVSAAEADLNTAIANTHQAHAAASTVQSTRGQLANAEAQLKEAEVRLGYTKIYAPVSGTVSVRAAREGEVLTPGQPICHPGGFERHLGARRDSGNRVRQHRSGRHAAHPPARRHHYFRQSVFQGAGSRFCHPARRQPAQARHQDHRAQSPPGQSQGRLCARHDGGSAGFAGPGESRLQHRPGRGETVVISNFRFQIDDFRFDHFRLTANHGC